MNLTTQPTVVLSQTIKISIDKTTASNQNFYFPYDEIINNSWIKGIRFEPKNTGGNNGTISNSDAITLVGVRNTKDFFITLKNDRDESVVDNLPLYALAGISNVNGTQSVKVVPRMNLRVCLQKCFLSLSDPAATFTGNVAYFTIFYKPLK